MEWSSACGCRAARISMLYQAYQAQIDVMGPVRAMEAAAEAGVADISFSTMNRD